MAINNRQNWNFSFTSKNILKDKNRLIRYFLNYMILRTQRMFEWEGLPETIPQKDLELIIQLTGSATISEVDGKLYAFYGGLGGELNEYYQPTLSVVANPYLKLSKVYEIGENCTLILNDALYLGLSTLHERYATTLAEITMSLRYATINTRIPMIGVANDDNTAQSFKELFDAIEKGEDMKAVVTNSLVDENSFRTQEYFSKGSVVLKDLVELYQFTWASWWNEIGVQSNFNMKREALNDSEVSMNIGTLAPLVDEMLYQREQGAKRLNEMFGLNVSVKLSSAWEQLKLKNDIVEEEIEKVEDGEYDEIQRISNA